MGTVRSEQRDSRQFSGYDLGSEVETCLVEECHAECTHREGHPWAIIDFPTMDEFPNPSSSSCHDGLSVTTEVM